MTTWDELAPKIDAAFAASPDAMNRIRRVFGSLAAFAASVIEANAHDRIKYGSQVSLDTLHSGERAAAAIEIVKRELGV